MARQSAQSIHLSEGVTSMNTLWKQALIAAALGTAVTAGAQYTSPPASSPGATPDPSPMTKPATGAATSSPQDRMPANRDQEAMKACANTPASEREACIAREKARNNGTKSPMSSGSSTTTPGTSSSSGGGQSSGTSSGSSTGGANGASNGTSGATGGAQK
jgi:hypothetical protein